MEEIGQRQHLSRQKEDRPESFDAVKGSVRSVFSAFVFLGILVSAIRPGFGDAGAGRLNLGTPAEKESWVSTGWTPLQLSLFNPVQIFEENDDVYGFRFNLLYGKNRNMFGLDLGIVNSTRHFGGFQVGLWNETYDVYGFQIGLIGNVARGPGEIDPAVFKRYEDADQLIGSYKNFGGVGEIIKRISRLSLVLSPMILGRADVYGAQISLGFNSAGRVIGFQCCGIFNSATGNVVGFQVGLLYNFAEDVYGFQLAPIGLNRARDLYGIQLNVLGANLATGRSIGLQISILGNTAAELYGLQLGFFNLGGGGGIQIGFVNLGQPFGGIQAGFMNRGGVNGISIGVINQHELPVNGIAIALENGGGGSLKGMQIALLENVTRSAAGLQVAGLWNRNTGDMYGLQVAGIFNNTDRLVGVQVGSINIAGRAKGVQIGVVNYAESLYGLQIGLINIHRNGILFLPIFNFGTKDEADQACRFSRDCPAG